jgi:hypothetical protein
MIFAGLKLDLIRDKVDVEADARAAQLAGGCLKVVVVQNFDAVAVVIDVPKVWTTRTP